MDQQERLLILVDHYQRMSADTLVQAKKAHDVAFRVTSTLEDHLTANAGAIEALQRAQQALAAIHALLVEGDRDEPAGPAMSAPIMILN